MTLRYPRFLVLMAIALAVCLASLGLAHRWLAEARQAAAETEDLNRSRAELARAAQAASIQLNSIRKALPTLTARASAADANDFAELYAAANVPEIRDAVDGHLVAKRPADFANVLSSAYHSMLALRYGPLFAGLHFTEAQKAAFEDLLTKDHDEDLDILATAAKDHLTPADPAVAPLLQQAAQQHATALLALLGEANFSQYQDYERALPATPIVFGVLQENATTPGALTPAQAWQLLGALTAASPEYQAGGKVAVSKLDWPAVLTASHPFLTAPQYEILREDAAGARANALLKNFLAATQPTTPAGR